MDTKLERFSGENSVRLGTRKTAHLGGSRVALHLVLEGIDVFGNEDIVDHGRCVATRLKLAFCICNSLGVDSRERSNAGSGATLVPDGSLTRLLQDIP